jgi:alkylation response protein AidB-like acyl-CoA dehydrogenase
MFLMDMKTPGITIETIKNCTGDEIFADVFYDNVRVPAISLIGGENNGWKVVNGLLVTERGGIERMAASRRMLDELVQYTKETKRNGKLLCENPIIRQKLAQLAIDIEAGRLFVYRIAWMQSQGVMPGVEVSVAKLFGGELVQRVGRVAMEILGLHGQLTMQSKHKALGGKCQYWALHTLCRTLGGGSSEMQRNIIARYLGMPRE